MYGGPTPKRHVAYSNSSAIGLLDLGKLRGWAQKVRTMDARGEKRVKTVEKYKDKQGRLRYKGSTGLKPSESDPHLFDDCQLNKTLIKSIQNNIDY